MSYKTILVHVEGVPEFKTRLHLAGSLANHFEAVLIGRAAAQMRLPIGVPGGDATLVNIEHDDVERELASAEKLFNEMAPSIRQGTEWRTGPGLPNQALAREARAADLLVVGRNSESLGRGMYRTVDPGDLVIEAGRPVLVFAPETPELSPERILIAWKDARQTRRAVCDAIPFLRRAKEVLLTTVQENENHDEERIAVEDAARHLHRHGVKARPECLPRRESSVADEILLRAEQAKADLIVAGAYGHARMREWIFGGVTETLLARSPKACLLSH